MSERDLIRRLLPYTRDLPVELQQEVAPLLAEPFALRHIERLAAILSRYENPEPMRDSDFIQMARADVSQLASENQQLLEYVSTVDRFRNGLASKEELNAASEQLSSWLASNSEGR
jgi:hypothetical protein